MTAQRVFHEAVPIPERPPETLFATLVVSSDSATTLPVEHRRARFTFTSEHDWRIYEAAVRVWLASMPTPETVREAALKPAPPAPRRRLSPGQKLGQILDVGNLDLPEPEERPYDFQRDGC